MTVANIEAISRAVCEVEIRSLWADVEKFDLPALIDRYWPVIAAEISAGLRDEDGHLQPHSAEAGLAAWEAWLDEHPDQRKPIRR